MIRNIVPKSSVDPPHWRTGRVPAGGFSLIELMVGMAVTLMVLASLSHLFLSQHHNHTVLEVRSEMAQSLLTGMAFVEREIRLTGYGLPPATPSLIRIDEDTVTSRLDLDSDGGINTLSFRYSPERNQLQRKIDNGNWAPLAENVTGLAFRYLDHENQTTMDPLSVRKIAMTLTVRAYKPDPSWPENGGYRTETRTRTIYLRNEAG